MVYARTESRSTRAFSSAASRGSRLADFLLGTGDRGASASHEPWTPYGWSYTSALPVEADVLIKAHTLTGDERYFKGLIGETQFGLGANPDNMTFTTGLGHRSPREVLLVDKFGMGDVPDGLTLFGGWNVGDRGQHWSFEEAALHMTPRYPDAWPVHETFIGYFWAVPITEYTMHSTLGPVAKAWGYIADRSATPPAPGSMRLQASPPHGRKATPRRVPERPGDMTTGEGAVLVLPAIPDRGIVLVSEPAQATSTDQSTRAARPPQADSNDPAGYRRSPGTATRRVSRPAHPPWHPPGPQHPPSRPGIDQLLAAASTARQPGGSASGYTYDRPARAPPLRAARPVRLTGRKRMRESSASPRPTVTFKAEHGRDVGGISSAGGFHSDCHTHRPK
jgi:hypothetical protein